MLRIEEVNEQNYQQIIQVRMKPDQFGFMQTVEEIIEEHKNQPDWISVGLYDDELLVGYALYGRYLEFVWLDDILIDENYQHQGYGRAFILFFISFLHEKYETNHIYLSVFETNKVAIKLYESLGFHFTNDYDSLGELIYVYDIV